MHRHFNRHYIKGLTPYTTTHAKKIQKGKKRKIEPNQKLKDVSVSQLIVLTKM